MKTRYAFLLTLALTLALSACNFEEFNDSMTPSNTDDSLVNANQELDPDEKPPYANPFIDTNEDNLATFSVDVDTASYSMMRRNLREGVLPDPYRIRIEEFINYFRYDYPQPTDEHPFSITLEAAPSYFGANKQMLKVGVQGETVDQATRPYANIVLLIDISGSMNSADKLGFVKYSAKTLINALQDTDMVTIVTYAGEEKVALQPTAVANRTQILNVIDNLYADGGTNGMAGLSKAYELAQQARCENNVALQTDCTQAVNRVLLCTDGDFNLGMEDDEIISTIASWRDKGVYLSVLGYGMDNIDDAFLESMTNSGNGNYYYIDSHNEARRVLEDELGGTVQVIAEDVKVQVEFNADVISRYRLVGYENRVLEDDDFEDDSVDAGDIGSGHQVTAFLEFELRDEVKIGSGLQVEIEEEYKDTQFIDVRVRYKRPGASVSTEVVKVVPLDTLKSTFDEASTDFRFAAAVTEYAEILRKSPHAEGDRFDEVIELANGAFGDDTTNRQELVELVGIAKGLWQ